MLEAISNVTALAQKHAIYDAVNTALLLVAEPLNKLGVFFPVRKRLLGIGHDNVKVTIADPLKLFELCNFEVCFIVLYLIFSKHFRKRAMHTSIYCFKVIFPSLLRLIQKIEEICANLIVSF